MIALTNIALLLCYLDSNKDVIVKQKDVNIFIEGKQ